MLLLGHIMEATSSEVTVKRGTAQQLQRLLKEEVLWMNQVERRRWWWHLLAV